MVNHLCGSKKTFSGKACCRVVKGKRGNCSLHRKKQRGGQQQQAEKLVQREAKITANIDRVQEHLDKCRKLTQQADQLERKSEQLKHTGQEMRAQIQQEIKRGRV